MSDTPHPRTDPRDVPSRIVEDPPPPEHERDRERRDEDDNPDEEQAAALGQRDWRWRKTA